MSRLTKIARVILDEEAIEHGYANRHEMYKALDRARATSNPTGFRETNFANASIGALTGGITGAAALIGLGAIPGIAGRLAERSIDLELASRNTNNAESAKQTLAAGSAFGAGVKGALGGTFLGSLGGAVAGSRMGASQERLLDKIRTNRL